jgi:D-alanine-D-alanine ligase
VTLFDVKDRELTGIEDHEFDAVFLALHGHFGEDGGVQRRLEKLAIPYTGSGVRASTLAFDKIRAKRWFELAGLRTPRWVVLDAAMSVEEAEQTIKTRCGYPCVIKPACEGSSIGVSLVKSKSEVGAALDKLHGLSDIGVILVEEFIPGRELTVAVLDDVTLPAVEVLPGRAFYDYEAKYETGSGTDYELKPALRRREQRELQAGAGTAHRVLGCAGATRVDFRMPLSGMPFVLEVNTIPGMTETSLLPKAAESAGIPFGELCERILIGGIQRAQIGLRRAGLRPVSVRMHKSSGRLQVG